MALDIPLDLHNTGQACRYWRITSVHLDHAAGQVSVWLHGWADAGARQAGRTAPAALHMVLRNDDLTATTLHGATTGALYAALKVRAAREVADPALERDVASFGPALLAGARDC